MAIPDFIREIRATAGQQLLLLPGVTAVVFDDEGKCCSDDAPTPASGR